MVIDTETFTEMTLSLRRASDGLLEAAQVLAALSGARAGGQGSEVSLGGAVEALVSTNKEFSNVESMLRTVWEANRGEQRLVC